MISSVIAKLNCDDATCQHTMSQIESHAALDLGKLVDGRSLPITIEAAGNQETEEITRWIMSLDGVDFVDVVFVHMEDDDSMEAPVRKPRKLGGRTTA